jgi:hypothetical protein
MFCPEFMAYPPPFKNYLDNYALICNYVRTYKVAGFIVIAEISTANKYAR